jgi:hypothetical protein
MRSGSTMALFGLLLALVAGCNRKPASVTPQVAAMAPSRPAWEMAQLIPAMPVVPPYVNEHPVILNASVPAEPEVSTEEARPKKPRHHLRTQEATQQEPAKPATQNSTPDAEVAANNQPSESSPIGQLTTSGGDTNTGDRQTMLDQINGMENTLNGIHRPLSSDEQKTAALIRTFLTRARDALKTDDLDGAKNYSTKAKLLLQELTKT